MSMLRNDAARVSNNHIRTYFIIWRLLVEIDALLFELATILEAGDLANRHPPQLRTHDRFGKRIDEVEFHPSYHELMQHVFGNGMHSIGWRNDKPGGHVAHAAMVYMMAQVETGVCCPAAMT